MRINLLHLIRCLILLVVSIPLFPAHPLCADDASAVTPSAVEDVIPLTMGNLRGHKLLYDEGWYVVTSSRRALEFAREKSMDSSAEALRKVRRDAAQRSGTYAREMSGGVKGAVASGKELLQEGTGLSGTILTETDRLARKELAYASKYFRDGMDSFIKGNLSLGKRTAQERAELRGLPGNYFSTLKDDFSNIWGLTNKVNDSFANKIEPGWDGAFAEAGRQFQEEYERSGNEKNSLMALGPILSGYLKSLYRGLAVPASKSLVRGGAKGATGGLFLPVAGATMIAGRTVESVGLTFYYTGKSAVKIVSPTVEGGLLSGLSLLSLGAVPTTYVTGGTLGAINQVAFTAAAPGYAVAKGTAAAAVDTAKYVSFLTYDGLSGTTRVVINQAQSGVVLGYNALTAIPAHLLTGAMDSAIFLAWDGPRLVVAAAQGRLKGGDRENPVSMGDLPVGSVVDLKRLKEEGGVAVSVVSDDPAVLGRVLKNIPADLRQPPEQSP